MLKESRKDKWPPAVHSYDDNWRMEVQVSGLAYLQWNVPPVSCEVRITLWAQLNGTLYATTFLSQQKGESIICQTCLSPDHHTYQRVLCDRTPNYQSTSPLIVEKRRARSRSPDKGICYAWNDGRCNRCVACKWKHNVCLKYGKEHKAIQCTTYKKKKQ